MIVFVGMDGVDKERVQRIVYEMSKGSKYFENEEKKEASMKEKIEYMRSQCEKLTPKDLAHFQKVCIVYIAMQLMGLVLFVSDECRLVDNFKLRMTVLSCL